MLVLSRRVNESIQIGDDVTVTVLSCKGNHIRIGISAPKELSVHREEVYLRNRRSGTALRAPNEQTPPGSHPNGPWE